MGIKDEGEHQNEVTEDNEQEILDEKKKQHDEFFSRLDKDYEFARMTTHTQRGVGLGWWRKPPTCRKSLTNFIT
jgi:hypothetical protein